MKKLSAFGLAAAAFFTFNPLGAHAADEGYARPWQLGLQSPATPVMARLYGIHNDLLLPLITAITIFVLALLVYICLRFRRGANPVPSKTTHNTRLEIIWTAIPIVILVAIAIPSLRAHYFMQRVVEPEMTLKVVGYQWYWHYDYPDNGGFGFDSYLKKDNLAPGEHRLLAVDNRVVVPVDTTIRVLLTGADVIHSWSVPAFGVKKDAVPGKLNETWFRAEKIGTYYGQCSQLCGVGHGFMPIVVEVVSKNDFAAWVGQHAQAANGNAPENPQAPENKQQQYHLESAKEGGKVIQPSAQPVGAAKTGPAAKSQVPLAQPQANMPTTKPQTATDKTTNNEGDAR